MTEASNGRTPLHAFALVEALPAEAQTQLLRQAVSHDCAPGTVLFVQDEPCAGLFFVREGLVKISKVSVEGREQVLRHVGPGGSFNEVAVLDGGPNPATATVVEPSALLVIRPDAMRRALEDVPGLADAIIRVLTARMRHLVELVEDLSFRHVSERVARILLQASTPHGGVGAGINLTRRLSQRELAEMAGTSREVVARALKVLEEAGAIRVHHGKIELLAPDRLTDLS
ncbi:MAG: Crp/Fnr family transcriptional regulator [Chloroflexi bacterium HGW-Chloroflexi-9]|nr:MAG: Crp/Fnr family transcriptional regulator [Chloroflexi bacterium HGW-Chloroflexi-9]